ncbi:nicotinate-nucleotide adenylyltransferase [Heliorestis convoluta]|uniref:Probable nicotinate-nucleotide adenylyltransferase n=1 Tax=Heliorestis convoluta TaxID=356322 RepID=A0A5Q2N0D4_9FIRM|nr:nicotinate-nucleotide adenylyltransferase [Heliorestis convoluta]
MFISAPYGVIIPKIDEKDKNNYDWEESSFGLKVPKRKLNKADASSKTKIGIMGGTFDPIHYGHLVTAEAAAERFNLSPVVFVPSGRPPHKQKQKVTDSRERLRLTELATLSNCRFRISDIEVKRTGYSYTIDTVQWFYHHYGPNLELYFITGADAIVEIMSWHQVERLIQYCQFIAVYRPGYERDHLHKTIAQWSVEFSQRIHLIEVPALAISSTDIRERLQKGRSIKYLVPEPVEHYIRAQQLYR